MKKNEGTDFLGTFLKEVVEGKIFLEEERLIISEELKNQFLTKNNILSAMNAIFDIPVETFSSIPEKKIISFQLEQFRLALGNNDLIKADVCSKKIRKRFFNESREYNLEDEFYELMLELAIKQKNFLEASKILIRKENLPYIQSHCMDDKNTHDINDTINNLNISNAEANNTNILSINRGAFFALIGSADNIYIIKLIELKNNSDEVRYILNLFLKNELITSDLIQQIKNIFKDSKDFDVELLRSIDIYNLEVLSKFFTKIKIEDLKKLIGSENIIDRICYSVNNKFIDCKIDELNQIVVFNKKIENEWIVKIDSVLNKIIESNGLIHKENIK